LAELKLIARRCGRLRRGRGGKRCVTLRQRTAGREECCERVRGSATERGAWSCAGRFGSRGGLQSIERGSLLGRKRVLRLAGVLDEVVRSVVRRIRAHETAD